MSYCWHRVGEDAGEMVTIEKSEGYAYAITTDLIHYTLILVPKKHMESCSHQMSEMESVSQQRTCSAWIGPSLQMSLHSTLRSIPVIYMLL